MNGNTDHSAHQRPVNANVLQIRTHPFLQEADHVLLRPGMYRRFDVLGQTIAQSRRQTTGAVLQVAIERVAQCLLLAQEKAQLQGQTLHLPL